MKDEDVGVALRQLPRLTTSPRFASDVLRAVRTAQEPARAPMAWWRVATSCAMVVLVVFGIYAGSMQYQKQQRLEALRAEHRRLETELQQVKAMADDAPPVVVLDKGDTRVIVDLNRTQQTYY